MTNEPIFTSAIRSFVVTIFSILGLLVGGVFAVLTIGGLTAKSEGLFQTNYNYAPTILPNDVGIRKEVSSTAPVILQVNIQGTIGLGQLTQKKVESLLVESRERTLSDNRVKAILLNINTPGGTVNDADGIYRAIKNYKHQYQVPVYAFVDGICASGGFYIAAAADKIYATDVSLIGSVGVLLPTILNFSGALDLVKIKTLSLYDGKGKDNLNPLRPWAKGEEDNIKAAIEYYYQMFVDIVTRDRPSLSKEKLINTYGASVYPAPIAKEHGYIDEHGSSLRDVTKLLAARIGVDDDHYQIIELSSNSWVSELFDSEFKFLRGQVTHQFQLDASFPTELQGSYLYLYRPITN